MNASYRRINAVLAADTEADAAGMPPAAPGAEQSDSQQTVLSYAGSAPPEDAERDMLHLDDELAGLVKAADMPAAQAEAHTTKPKPVSPVAGQLAFAHSMSADALLLMGHAVPCLWVCNALLQHGNSMFSLLSCIC